MLETLPENPHEDRFRVTLSDPAFQIFYHAPVMILISGIAEVPWIVEDCALAAQNLMLAAYGLGLGSCWIGFAQRYLNTPAGKRHLDVPDLRADRADHRRIPEGAAADGAAHSAAGPLGWLIRCNTSAAAEIH